MLYQYLDSQGWITILSKQHFLNFSLGLYFFCVRNFTGFPFLVLLHTSIVFLIKMSFERTLKTKGFLAPLVAIVNILGKVI